MMTFEDKSNLSKSMMLKAKEALEEAIVLKNQNKYIGASNRLYYAVFHSTNAVLILKGLSARKHSGVQSLFNKEFIKTELIDEKFSDIFNEIKIIRENSDYDYFYVIDKGMVNENLIRVKQFVEEMEKFVIGVLNGKINI